MIIAVYAAGSGAAAEIESNESVPVWLELFASGLNSPVSIASAGAVDGRLFMNEEEGRIKIVRLDVDSLVGQKGADSPNFAK